MEYKHICPGNELIRLVDILHPISFAGIPKEGDGNRFLETLSSSCSGPELRKLFEEISRIHSEEKRLGEELRKYGEKRKEIVDKMAMEVASCRICRHNYRLFLEGEVNKSKRDCDCPRGPYDSVEGSDRDFLNVGVQINRW